MSKITQISTQSKNKERCNVFVDEEFAIGVSLETVMKFRLKVGMEITKEKLLEITLDAEKTDAMNKAVGYVSKTLKTKKQVVT